MKMKKAFIKSLISGSALLMLGCATPVTRYTLQEVVSQPPVKDIQFVSDGISDRLPDAFQLIVVSGVSYLLPVECLSSRQFAGQFEKRKYSGSSEGRNFHSSWEQRTFAGAIESRAKYGMAESRVFNGAAESRLHEIESEVRLIDAAAENRRYELSSEQRIYGGQEGNLYCIPSKLTSTISIVNDNWAEVNRIESMSSVDVKVN